MSSAIVDASTIESLVHDQFENFLITEPSYYSGVHGIERLRQQTIEAFSSNDYKLDTHTYLRNAFPRILALLEAYVLYDELIIDESSLSTVLSRNSNIKNEQLYTDHLSRIVSSAPLTETHKAEINTNVSSFIDILNQNDIKSIFNFYKSSDIELEPVSYMFIKDGAMSEVSSTLFGQSTNKPIRALFYHELSQCSGMPLILHPVKHKILNTLNTEILSNISDLYSKLTGEVIGQLSEYELDLQMPPLAFALLTESLKNDIPLIDAAINMKQDREVVSLRNLLSKLHNAEQQGRLYYQKQIKKSAREIVTRLNERSEYTMPFLSSKTLYLNEIPAISNVLKLLGIGKVSCPDIILYEKPYVTLFDKWVNFSPYS